MARIAIHGYGFNAIDFIVKPVSYYVFADKLGKFCLSRMNIRMSSEFYGVLRTMKTLECRPRKAHFPSRWLVLFKSENELFLISYDADIIWDRPDLQIALTALVAKGS
jgi:hypothetical protein